MIRQIEEFSLNAWPALQTVLVDGWVVRFANGYTRRANSVNPLYAGQGDAEQCIATCEGLYRSRGLPVVFKMTAAACPAGLDERLAACGYASEAHTSVQVLELDQSAAADDGAIALYAAPEPAWQEASARMHALSESARQTHAHMLSLIAPQTCYATLTLDGQPAACGLAVLQDGWAGFYDIITETRFRRQGCGERLMRALLAWAVRQGAHSAYLQVMLNNPAALALYAKLGFREAYRYWYRVKP